MQPTITHLSKRELLAGLDHIKQSPKDSGTLELIVARPSENERKELQEAFLDEQKGLIGDSWEQRGSSRTADGRAHPDMQLNIMNARVAQLVAQDKSRWALAGDQLYVDLDISSRNLPAGSRLGIGKTIIEVTEEPHTGCKKFVERFGIEAMKFVNAKSLKELHLRGINARVVKAGTIKHGDKINILS